MWRLFEPFHSVYQVAAVLLLWSRGKAKNRVDCYAGVSLSAMLRQARPGFNIYSI